MVATVWFSSLLLLLLSPVSPLTSFPDTLEAGIGGNVTLTCDTDRTLKGPLLWKHSRDGDTWPVEMTDFQVLNEKQLVLLDLEEAMSGEYSCWDGNTLLYHTHLLLNQTWNDAELHCWAENYGCMFYCSWSGVEYTAIRLRNERDGGEWVWPSDKGVFSVSHSTNQYAEEVWPLRVTLEAINSERILRISKKFYLREIIQPPHPAKVNSKSVGETLLVMVEPPAAWATPTSYYPLEHEIEYQRKDDGQVKKELCCKDQDTVRCWKRAVCHVAGRVSRFRVRSRDPLVLSQWSQWSQWKNVKKRVKKNRRKGTKRRTKQ
ncbi:interleukin-12 subunit beta [Denticeps clupeoides]|uniref:interleukin-12 subunit beta n=1 Tax=Denticeps clupeoides TaxID=299321 RepID=UPI0010A49DFF|nr:interleukin-12 subunit beta-like [Denticeps clupeoides]